MANGDCLDIGGNGTIKIKMHNSCVQIFCDVRYPLILGRNLISLVIVDTLGYGCSIKNGVI